MNIGSIYLLLRSGSADSMITAPLERIIGIESDIVRNIKKQLDEANQQQQQQQQSSTGTNNTVVPPTTTNEPISSSSTSSTGINFVREGTYLGIASLVDSLVLPVKLAVCLPIAKYVITRRR